MATIPMYAGQPGSSWKAAKILGTASDGFPPPPPPPQPTSHAHRDSLDAALDGPPSPSRLRQLSKQIRRDSYADKHQSQHTTSSGSSSLLSTSERPSWEQGADQLTLSRKSSQRSSSGSMPPRVERPDSLQIFGKTLFNRRGKIRRGSSDQGSIHSGDVPEPPPPVPKERESQAFLNSMMSRRRGSRDTRADEPSVKKVQISGPYNFQHLTHAPKNDAADLEQSNRPEPAANFSEVRWGRRPTDPFPLKGMEDRFHFNNFSSEALSSTPEDSSVEQYGDSVDPLARVNPPRERSYSSWQKRVVSPPAPLRPLAKRTHSEEQMRGPPPPRPPRSPLNASFSSNNPVPPPRLSSRGSIPMQPILTRPPAQPAAPPVEPAESEQAEGAELSRTRTNSSLRQPAPFVLSPPPRMPDPPATAMGLIREGGPEDGSDDGFSHAVTTPDDAAWPLTSNLLNALPDVPEEEESWIMARHQAMHRSRGDSLRGSISAPMLRRPSAAHALMPNRRPPSNASETLGKFDLFAAQRFLQDEEGPSVYDDDFLRDDWEDDIDYCYEHAAEADCDYAWERPSCDMIREDEHEDEDAVSPRQQVASPRETSAGPPPRALFPNNGYDVPALSPASQTSLVTPHEALTPTVQQGPVTSNFSLPRRDSSTINMHRGHLRAASSRGSIFKESQGFNLSPSLVIPTDFHQQMLLHERAEQAELREEDEDEEFMGHNSYLECPTNFGNSSSKARSSSSTFHSTYSEQSTSSSRHKSSQSTSTAFTRWTASSTSTSLEGWQAPSDDNEKPAEEDVVNALPVFDDNATKRELSRERHMRAQSHADIMSVKAGFEPAAQETKAANEPLRTRRRARTTSRGHNPPQLGLFPSTTASHPMMGGRI